MGYDMYWHKAPERAEDVGIFDDPAYFRLNIWGMGRVRRAMAELGMVYVAAGDEDEFPNLASYGLTQAEYEAIEYHAESWADEELKAAYAKVTEGQKAAHEQYEKAVETHLSAHPRGGSGIPVHKLGSNDGWIVTPEEISQALTVYYPWREKHGKEHEELVLQFLEATDPDWLKVWNDWIEWMDKARQYEGFRVH